MATRNEPLVSIVMPLYNCERYVEDSIKSVMEQTYSNWELIIVDDYSTDQSYILAQSLSENDTRIKLHQMQTNSGVAKVRNHGLSLALGKYIAFLDSDDMWLPTKLEKQIILMEENAILLSYTSYATINEKNETTGMFSVKKRVTYHDMLKTSTIGTLTTVYNAEKLGKYYFQDIGHEDYVMKLQILKDIEYAEGIEEPLAKYRMTNNGLSGNKFKTALWQWKIYRDSEQLSITRRANGVAVASLFRLKKYN